MIRRVLLSLAIASVITYFVYLAMMDSLNRSSINYLSISNDTAVSIILKHENLSSQHLNNINSKSLHRQLSRKNFSDNYHWKSFWMANKFAGIK